MVLVCENLAIVVSGRDGSKPFSAMMSRKMTLSSRRVAADFGGATSCLLSRMGCLQWRNNLHTLSIVTKRKYID